MTLTADEWRLLRDVHTWARSQGWRRAQHDPTDRQWAQDGPAYDENSPTVTLWRPDYGDNGVSNLGDWELRIYYGTPYRCVSIPKTSVREAIDILAALDIIPTDMSTAWHDGAQAVTELSIMSAVDTKLDQIWDAFQLRHVQDAVTDALKPHLEDASPYDLRKTTEQAITAFLHALEKEVDK